MVVPQSWVPKDYQLDSLEFMLKKKHCGLMLDPGLGKTSVVLAGISVLKERGEFTRALVVAPKRVAMTVWPVEAKKWLDFNHLKVVHLCEMDDSERAFLLGRKDIDVFVINPESLYKLLSKDLFPMLKANMFVVDESTKFKDTTTKRFKALKPFLGVFDRRIVLTGTPSPNGLQDLFGQMYIVDQGAALGRFITHFRQAFLTSNPYNPYKYEITPGAAQEIYRRISPSILRLRAKDNLVMPEVIFNFIEVTLPSEVRKLYNQLEKTFVMNLLKETVVAFNAGALGVKLRQVSNGFAYSADNPGTSHPIHNEKLDALEELIEEMQGRPLLLLYEFIEDGKRIQERFPQVHSIYDGDVNETIEKFNAGEIPVLCGHPASMGHGLNLQEMCNTVCWYGVTWNLEHYQQANARIWRQGQKANNVVIHHIVSADTIDQLVMTRLTEKDATQEGLNQALVQYARGHIAELDSDPIEFTTYE